MVGCGLVAGAGLEPATLGSDSNALSVELPRVQSRWGRRLAGRRPLASFNAS